MKHLRNLFYGGMAGFIVVVSAVFPLKALGHENKNLVVNPGFENHSDKFSPWRIDNWWSKKIIDEDGEKIIKNKIAVSLESENVFEGKQCLKMSLLEFHGGDLGIVQAIDLEPGLPLRIRFAIRGEANSAPVRVMIRQLSKPYTRYFTATVNLDENWREHSFDITLSQRLSGEKYGIFFRINEVNTVYLDQVAVEKLPPRDDGEIQVGNQILNGSFEAGTDKWYAFFRENQTIYRPEAELANINAGIQAIEISDCPDGKKVLFLEVFPYCRAELTSAFFPLRYGHETKISFRYRSKNSGEGRIKAALISGEFPNHITDEKAFKCMTGEWRKAEFSVIPKPSPNGRYTISLQFYGAGKYWIDDVRVWQDSGNGENMRPVIGWEVSGERQPGNFYAKGEFPEFKIMAYAPGRKQINLTGKVIDAWEREQYSFESQIEMDHSGHGDYRLCLPELKNYGGFKLTIAECDLPEVMTEILFAVPHEFTPLNECRDFFFGGHVQLTPYNLHFAEKTGFRILRLHDMNMDTKWVICERKKGELTFHTDVIRMANEKGFKLMGSLCTVPDFYAAPKNRSGLRHTWHSAYPPKDEAAWNAYENYVAKTVNAFLPYIKIWEVGNESDGKFLQIPDGMNREEIYMEFIRRTAKATEGMNDIVLIGGVTTGVVRPFLNNILEMGAGKFIDAVSFHHYNPMSVSHIKSRMREIESWRKYHNRVDKEMPIWQTESKGGQTLTWLRSTGLAFVDTPAFNRQWAAAGETVQSIVVFKMIGLNGNILYNISAQKSGSVIYRNQINCMVEKNGLPLPASAAHAAAVYFLEESTPVGVKFLPGAVVCASFVKSGKEIDVVWAEKEVELDSVTELRELESGRAIFDMMGNPVSETSDIQLTAAPLYFVKK